MKLYREKLHTNSEYPFCLTAVRNLHELEFHPNVTFIVGENGTGKSTILESIAVAYGFNPEGGTKNFSFSSNNTHSDLYKHIKLVKGIKRPRDGFFLRAESFYNLATNIDELEVIESYGGVSLHQQSHGESFFAVFMNRFSGQGLYILDEPEAALSPSRQMAMLARIHELVEQESQFIIATHSPIIMAYPNSRILQVEENFNEVKYEQTEHYQTMRTFLNNTEKMLKILMEP
ncbi:AAA family ATPase [Petroclostridium sp. X23]|jgi:predicted ATPase|uniref:AAA family ATPase n=1 Tax=Petroclostridium sp. X23 TaxID=3045146 RepID=UPI0024ACEE21|nr:AAA family ATPase [Petroclostridium sp. X23]WHH61633.1 AAA family ATPase [Petroclostridium sp. X23]